MARLALTLACGDYDRTRALATGAVRPDGVELNVITLAGYTFHQGLAPRRLAVEEMFWESTLAT